MSAQAAAASARGEELEKALAESSAQWRSVLHSLKTAFPDSPAVLIQGREFEVRCGLVAYMRFT